MMTIMLFTILLSVSDAFIDGSEPFTAADVYKELATMLGERLVGVGGYKPKTASIILRGNNKEYLLFQENSTRFSYPGGEVDYYPRSPSDATDLAAALREFREEAGFPLEQMIAAKANSFRKKKSLSYLLSGVRITPPSDRHQVFLINVDCALVDMLTKYRGAGAMSVELQRPLGDSSEQIINAGWSTYKVGSLAKVDPKEGDNVAFATIEQIVNAVSSSGHRIMRGSSGPGLRTSGPYMANLIQASTCE